MIKVNSFIVYCNSMMIANEGLFSSVKKILPVKNLPQRIKIPVLDGYEVGEPISGYDSIYSTKEKRASLVKDVLQIVNKVRAQSQFKKAVSDFIEEILNNAISQRYPGVKITSEGGDWDDGPISIVIKRW